MISETVKEDIRTKLRTRAFNLSTRKSRVEKLRQDFDPFTSSTQQNSYPSFGKSQSFSIKDHKTAIERVSKAKQVNGLASILQFCAVPSQTQAASPAAIRVRSSFYEDGEFAYDSDPEDFARRRSLGLEGNKENIRNSQIYSYPWKISASPTGTAADSINDEAFKTVVEVSFRAPGGFFRSQFSYQISILNRNS